MIMSDIKYPHVQVRLTGRDGNAFAIIAYVRNGLREAGLPEAANAWASDAMSSESYDELLALAMRTVTIY